MSKKYTAKELAEQFGCSIKTIHNHANALFGEGENGVTRYFDEAQTTMILELIKQANNNQHDLERSLQGAETALTPALKVITEVERVKDFTYEEKAVMAARLLQEAFTELQIKHVKTVHELKETKELLSARESGLSMLQTVCEDAGLLLTDKEDVANTYNNFHGKRKRRR
jgi:DNA-binding transcriptional MerR regulator